MLPALPQEIVDLIVDALAVQHDGPDHERFQNLQSSALVSRTFTVRARYHLFSNLTVRWIPQSKYERPTLHRTQQLKEFLETDPIFLKSIQTLDIGIPVPLHSNMLKQITGIYSGLSEIITLLYSTPMSRLHTLVLTGFTESILDSEAGLRDRTHFWHDIGFLPALYNLCLSGTLHNLKLGYLRDLPPEFFSKLHRSIKCITLTEVSLAEAVYLYSGPLPPTGTNNRPALEELHVPDDALFRIWHGSSSSSDVASCGPLLNRLRTLDCIVGFAPCGDLPYWTAIHGASETLSTLRLALDQSFHLQGADEFKLIDLGSLPALRVLIFQIKDTPPGYWTPLEAIIHMLATSSAPTSIEVIKIDILTHIMQAGCYDITKEYGKRTALDALDTALTGGMHPSLRSISLRVLSPALEIDIDMEHPDSYPWTITERPQPLADKLPRAHAVGLISYSDLAQRDLIV